MPKKSGSKKGGKQTAAKTTLAPEFIEEARKLRHDKKLHGRVTEKLKERVQELFPDWSCIPEISQTSGGRNDAVVYECVGRSVCFEVFATRGQVDRDLLLLHNSRAERKIAVVLDREIDSSILDTIYRKQPDNPYPIIYVSEILLEDRKSLLQLKLLHYVLGNRLAEAIHISRQLAQTANERIVQHWRKNGIDIYTGTEQPTFPGILALLVVNHLLRLGISLTECESAAKLVSERTQYIIWQIVIGGPLFLLRHEGEYFLMDHTDYTDWHLGTLLVRKGDFVRVLLNPIYDELRGMYKGSLPKPGDMLAFTELALEGREEQR